MRTIQITCVAPARSTTSRLLYVTLFLFLLRCIVGACDAAEFPPPIKISFVDLYDRVLIPAKVNGVRVMFQVDTGTNESVLFSSFVKKFHFVTAGHTTVDLFGHAEHAQYVAPTVLEVGRGQFKGGQFLSVGGPDWLTSFRYQGRPTAGILGDDFIGRGSLTIDYRNHSLILFGEASACSGTQFDVSIMNLLPFFPLYLDGNMAVGLFDTGSPVPVLVSDKYASEHHFKFSPDVVGSDSKPVAIAAVQIGPRMVNNVIYIGHIRYDALVGSGYFKNLTVTVDYKNSTFCVEPSKVVH
jgi:hypothetical protein